MKEKKYRKGPKGEMERVDDLIAEETPGTERYGKLIEQGTMLAQYKDAKKRDFWVAVIDIGSKIVVPVLMAAGVSFVESKGILWSRNPVSKMIPKGGQTELKRRDILGFKKK